MTACYLSIGSNQGEKLENLKQAVKGLGNCAGIIQASSKVYETAPWGDVRDQNDFLNQVICIDTTLNPNQMLILIHKIEGSLGRIKMLKWGPRVIDIDILFFGQEIVEMPTLIIPHPFLPVRKFVLQPLLEIAPSFNHPVLMKSVSQLFDECPDPLCVTELLQKLS